MRIPLVYLPTTVNANNQPTTVLAALAHAEYGPRNGGYGGWHGGGGGGWGYPGGGYGGNGDNDDDDDNGFGTGNNNGNGNGQFGAAGFDMDKAAHYRNIHGIIAAVAFIGLFPLGSILMRILPGRLAPARRNNRSLVFWRKR